MRARAKLSAFEYENKGGRESYNHTKRSNWSLFQEAPCRNPKPVENLKWTWESGFRCVDLTICGDWSSEIPIKCIIDII